MSDIKLACNIAEQVKAICDKYENQPGELINILHEAQHLQGYLPEEMQRIIARQLNSPRIESIWSSDLLHLLYHDPEGQASHLGMHGYSLLRTWFRKTIGRVQTDIGHRSWRNNCRMANTL